MIFTVDKKIFELFPDAQFGALEIKNIDNTISLKETEVLLAKTVQKISQDIKNKDLDYLPEIATWQISFNILGLDNKEFKPAHAALLSRVKSKGELPSINPLVNLYNSISIKRRIPVGGHNINSIEEIKVGFTGGDEIFKSMNSNEEVKINAGEPAYMAEKNILTRNLVWRQSEFSKIDGNTHSIFIPLDDLAGVFSSRKIQFIAEELVYLITKYLGGTAKFAIVNKYNNSINFETIENFVLENERNIKIDYEYEPEVNTDKAVIEQVVTRGIQDVLPSREKFIELLTSGKRITFFQGYDPTASKLHIGNALGMKFLEKMRKLGHQIIFLIGTGTGQIGDPTDKAATRKVLTEEDINNNISGWIEQASQVLDFDNAENPVMIVRNGDWLQPMKLEKFLDIGNRVTVQQLLERDMFQKRLQEGTPISISELVYPLLQGFDSVEMEVDGEFGGNDQLFNMMMGRTLLKGFVDKEKFVVTGKILADDKGVKMGKSLGNVINLTDSPEDIFGKIMSFTDGMVANGFEILTEIPLEKVDQIRKDIESGNVNPIEHKKTLAFEVVKWIKGEDLANAAKYFFEHTIQEQEQPENIDTVSIENIAEKSIVDLLVETNLAKSNSEAKRMIQQGGVEINGEKINDVTLKIDPQSKDQVIKYGKRQWIKII